MAFICNLCPRNCNAERDEHKIGRCGVGSALKVARAALHYWEEHKLMRKTISKEKREAEKQRRYDLKQQKRKEKHRGR